MLGGEYEQVVEEAHPQTRQLLEREAGSELKFEGLYQTMRLLAPKGEI